MYDYLARFLADTYALYLKTQNYHWNVEGMHFNILHNLFESQYTELAAAVDDIAERIRQKGERSPGSFKQFDNLKSINDALENATAQEMLSDLVESHQAIHSKLVEYIGIAQNAKDEVTVGFLTERMAYHEKTIWMISAHLKNK